MSNGGQERVPSAKTPPPASGRGNCSCTWHPHGFRDLSLTDPPYRRNTIFILADNVREMHRMCNLVQLDPAVNDVILLTNDTAVQRLSGTDSPVVLTFVCHDLPLHIVEFMQTRHGFIVPVYCIRCATDPRHRAMTKNRNSTRKTRWLMAEANINYTAALRQWAEHAVICSPNCPSTAICKRYRETSQSGHNT